ncbi:hypothetical protein [Pedobacter frigiditerrae]|nr:hypothetical protein [Pedobacter frigiditerrae]
MKDFLRNEGKAIAVFAQTSLNKPDSSENQFFQLVVTKSRADVAKNY